MFWTGPGILALEPAGRWKVRSIYRIVYNHGPVGIPGDVFFGGTHGTAVVHANGGMEEHQHAGWNYCSTPSPDSCSLLAGDHHCLALQPLADSLPPPVPGAIRNMFSTFMQTAKGHERQPQHCEFPVQSHSRREYSTLAGGAHAKI